LYLASVLSRVAFSSKHSSQESTGGLTWAQWDVRFYSRGVQTKVALFSACKGEKMASGILLSVLPEES